MGSWISGILGGGSSPGQQQQTQAIKASREDLQRYRQEAMQARLNALNAMTSAYQGTNNALETLWGDPNREPQRMPPQRRMLGHDMPQGMLPPQPQPPPQPAPQPSDGGGGFMADMADWAGSLGF